MSVNSVYKVIYHFVRGGKVVSENFQDFVLAASSDSATLAAVLSSNGKARPGGASIEIENIANVHIPAVLS